MELSHLLGLVGLVAAGFISNSSDAAEIFDLNNPFNVSGELKACDPQPVGSGPITTPDTVSAFHNNPVYGNIATAAPTPSGYAWFSYTGIPYGTYGTWSAVHMPWANYLGYHFLTSYDTAGCAAYCDALTTCQSFGIHYQRAPSVEASWDPTNTCYNPASTVQIMCTLWNRPIVKTDLEVNFGWARGGFQVAIVASKSYNTL